MMNKMIEMDDLSVVVVAGGRGKRFGAERPKQFLLLDERPVLMHTLEAFVGAREVVLVLPADQVEVWSELCVEYNFGVEHCVVVGGAERSDSVRAGLAAIAARDGLVAVHDGVRPWVSREVIERVAKAARRTGAAIPTIPVTDTVRQKRAHGGSITIDRDSLCAVQTPQIFSLDLLRRAYASEVMGATDDASVVEVAGHEVALVEGAPENRKITTPADL